MENINNCKNNIIDNKKFKNYKICNQNYKICKRYMGNDYIICKNLFDECLKECKKTKYKVLYTPIKN